MFLRHSGRVGWIDPPNEIVIGHTCACDLLSSRKRHSAFGRRFTTGGAPRCSRAIAKGPRLQIFRRATKAVRTKNHFAELNLKFGGVGACYNRELRADSRAPFLGAHQGYLRRVQIAIRRGRFGVRGSGVQSRRILELRSPLASILSLRIFSLLRRALDSSNFRRRHSIRASSFSNIPLKLCSVMKQQVSNPIPLPPLAGLSRRSVSK